MGARETRVIREILEGEGEDRRLFRINAGMGWAGKVRRLKSGAVVIANPYPLHAAPEGWPDICGWTSVTITPEMVGRRVAVFTFIEVKTAGTRTTVMQRAFLSLLRRMGGIAELVRDPDATAETLPPVPSTRRR